MAICPAVSPLRINFIFIVSLAKQQIMTQKSKGYDDHEGWPPSHTAAS